MNTQAIIQARLGSTRLPGKVLLEVMGRTVLEYVIERVRRAKKIQGLIIATTLSEKDLPVVKLAERLGVRVYRGSEEDVLDRFYHAAMAFEVENIVRITADCPLIDSDIIDTVVSYYYENKADYCSNALEPTFPDGEDVEVFSFNSLSCAWRNARLQSEREHVTPYIINHPEKFKLRSFKNTMDYSDKRWTLDEDRDFEFVKFVIESLYHKNPLFTMKDVLALVREHPEIEDVNIGIRRNEGYQKSVSEDKLVR